MVNCFPSPKSKIRPTSTEEEELLRSTNLHQAVERLKDQNEPSQSLHDLLELKNEIVEEIKRSKKETKEAKTSTAVVCRSHPKRLVVRHDP